MSSPESRFSPRLLFVVLIVAELVHTGLAIGRHRIPSSHDGFQYFTIQYYFLNNAMQGGGVAQWIPYMTHGTVATLWYGVQGSFLQQVLLYAAPFVRSIDLLTLFHLGVFVDEMVLLAGTWLLARRFFRAPSAFFVAVSVVGSCVWMDQPYWNFRLYYALPLVIELGHRFLESGRWRWCFAMGNLLALQTIGNLPYFIPVQSFVVGLYFASWFAGHRPEALAAVRALRWRLPALAALAGSAASFAIAYRVITIGLDQLVNYNAGRLPDGRTTLHGFLTYGGSTDLAKWIDMPLGLSPWFDFTLYAGVLALPLIAAGVILVDRRRLHFVAIAAVMLLFTLGTFVSVAAFYVWPAMKYFRHLGMVSPLVKVLCCFVAGIGFEKLFDRSAPLDSRAKAAIVTGGVLLAGAAVLAASLARSGPAMRDYVDRLTDPNTDRPMHSYVSREMARRLSLSSSVAVSGALVLVVVPFWMSRTQRSRTRLVLAGVVLVFVTADLYRFKLTYLFDRSEPVALPQRAAVQSAPMTYSPRRDRSLAFAAAGSARVRDILGFNQVMVKQLQGTFAPGAKYWSTNAFLFVDEVGSSYRVDSWLEPLNELLRDYWGQPIDDKTTAPPGISFEHFDFPLAHPSATTITGMTADKIRFFAHAYSVASPQQLAPLMVDASFAGNLLFVLPPAGESSTAEPWAGQQALAADDTRALVSEMQRYDANHVVVKVSAAARGTWMSYADVWHPSWRATVNGRPVPVSRAQLAYKAVPLEAGDNVVRFEFGSSTSSRLAAVLSANAVVWLAGLAAIVFGIVRRAD